MHNHSSPSAHADPSRWRSFTDKELATIRSALVSSAEFLAEDAAGGEIYHADLESAAAHYLTAVTLAHQIDDHRGERHPPIGEALETANLIRSGAAPAARTQPDHAA
jgi:hypothetical protein